jgi:signal transduction histidine kinase
MKLINNIINTGILKALLETVKRIKVPNSIALFSTVMVVLTFLTITIFNILPEITWLILIIGANLAIPLILNSFHKNISSRIYFVLISYAILIAMPLYLGFDLNYQFFILSGFGTPLMLFKDEIGWEKWILVGLVLPVWLFIEWYGINYPSLFQVSTEIAGTVSLTNGALVFLSVIFIFYTFIKQNDEQIAVIKKQKEDLVQLNEELEQFSYVVSHDLKAPLGGISTLIYFINEDNSDINPALKSMHELMQERTSKMDELIQ